jgi:hypothetical protein
MKLSCSVAKNGIPGAYTQFAIAASIAFWISGLGLVGKYVESFGVSRSPFDFLKNKFIIINYVNYFRAAKK